MRSAYPWMGGKFFEKKWVIPLMPKHYWYGEVFFGSGVLLLNKPKADEEFGNDLFAELVSFWKTLSSAWMTRRLWKKMQWSLDSRYEYQEYMRAKPEDLGILDRAFRFLYLVKFGFNSYMDTYYSPASHKMGKIKDFMGTWLNTAKQLYEYHDRVKKVHFSNYDFRVFLKKIHPNKGKFLFLDPPYYQTHSYDRGYSEDIGTFPDEYYVEMRELLTIHHDGGTMWQITCDQRNPFFDDMDDIIVKLIDRKACINKNEEKVAVKTKIIMNYDIKEVGSVLEMIEKPEEVGDGLLV